MPFYAMKYMYMYEPEYTGMFRSTVNDSLSCLETCTGLYIKDSHATQLFWALAKHTQHTSQADHFYKAESDKQESKLSNQEKTLNKILEKNLNEILNAGSFQPLYTPSVIQVMKSFYHKNYNNNF